MFLSRKDWTIAITVVYLFLIFLWVVEKNDQGVKQCDFYDSCVRFCCQNSSICKEDSIRKSFNGSANGMIYEPFIILRGRPKCSLEAVDKDHAWQFEYDNVIKMVDKLHGKVSYDLDGYCFQEELKGSEIVWNLLVCRQSFHVYKIIMFITSAISVLVLMTTVFVYAYEKELRTVPGRIFLMFAASTLVLAIFEPIMKIHFQNGIYMTIVIYGALVGLLLSFLWFSVLMFDIAWSFIFFRTPTDAQVRFKIYLCLVFGTIGAIIICLMAPEFLFQFRWSHPKIIINLVCFSFFAICAMDIAAVIVAAVKVFLISKATNGSENTRFEAEKERFWMYLELFAAVVVCWIIDLMMFLEPESVATVIISDLIICLTDVTIFIIFVTKKDIRCLLFKRYQSFNEIIPEARQIRWSNLTAV